jgi:RNA ligase (TIGR02306 family)
MRGNNTMINTDKPYHDTALIVGNLEEGYDLTDWLKIEKYEPPIPAQLAGKIKGMFPTFVKKTDQERIQNLPEYFSQYQDIEFEVTEKLDGSSCTYYWNEGQFGVCSRNLELLENENNSLWKIAKELKIKEYLTSRNVAVQGEIVGEGIQGNPYNLQGQKFFVFDIWDIEHQRHFTPKERADFIKPSFMKQVPMLENANSMPLKTMLDELLQASEGKSALNNLTEREGLVFKSIKRINGQVISFKVINNIYLLGEK